jgi:hypothetical protein
MASIRARSVHDRNALASSGIQINIVDTHAGAPDHSQFARMFEEVGIHLNRRANDQCVRRLQMRRQLALHLVGRDDGPARLA